MEKLKAICEELHIEFNETKQRQFAGYMEGILEMNKHVNLTAITDEEEFIEKHFIDSLLCGGSEEFLSAKRIIDVGTGGGFPGVPLAIAFPDKEFILMDSLNKRIKIVNDLCQKMEIANVKAIHGRAEDLGRDADLRDGFDVCISRAVADLKVLTEYCMPFVKEGGCFISYKATDCEAELEEAAKAISELGGKLNRKEDVKIHSLIFIDKIMATPAKYPRKAGKPSKQPIK